MEDIQIGTFVILNGKYLGFDEHGDKTFVESVKHATMYMEGLTETDAYQLLTQHKLHTEMDIENVSVMPVKKVIQYQLGEF